jgi:hypothetical protein
MTEFAEGHDHTGLTFLNDEKAADQPEESYHGCDDTGTDACTARVRGQAAIATATASLATEQTVQALIEIAPELVEVGWAVAGTLIVLPRFLGIVIGASTPAGIIQRKKQTKFVKKGSEHAVAFRVMVFFHLE